ncbi:DUF6809 family protein [Paenibacillus sp. FSL H8-0332]|uniref:DUF6809 family protein n=1 Tax=Paenibacillus sp. FSL H8-0332 TaxID=2954742 RepID=UPI0030CADBE7
MDSILESLYHGNLHPDENIIPDDPQYSILRKRTSDIIEVWKDRLSAEEFDELEALLDLYGQTHGMELAASFKYGFRLGAGIMVEILTGEEELGSRLISVGDKT